MSDKYWLVIPASGLGTRAIVATNPTPKQYQALDNGLSILDTTLNTLLNHSSIAGCVVAISQADTNFAHSKFYNHPKMHPAITGGKARYHSVFNAITALNKVAKKTDWILVHDAARPCITLADIDKLITQVGDDLVGGILASPITSTLKSTKNNTLTTIDREDLYQAQTPQMFRLGLLTKALANVITHNLTITDDAQAVELLGYCAKIVVGNEDNIKITYPNDLNRANLILANQ